MSLTVTPRPVRVDIRQAAQGRAQIIAPGSAAGAPQMPWSAVLPGAPSAAPPPPGDASTRLATTGWVQDELPDLVTLFENRLL